MEKLRWFYYFSTSKILFLPIMCDSNFWLTIPPSGNPRGSLQVFYIRGFSSSKIIVWNSPRGGRGNSYPKIKWNSPRVVREIHTQKLSEIPRGWGYGDFHFLLCTIYSGKGWLAQLFRSDISICIAIMRKIIQYL